MTSEVMRRTRKMVFLHGKSQKPEIMRIFLNFPRLVAQCQKTLSAKSPLRLLYSVRNALFLTKIKREQNHMT